MGEPTALELQRFIGEGRTQIEAAERWGISRSRVQRILKVLENGPGPTERAIRRLVETWGEMDPTTEARAETLLTLAVIADKGRAATVGVAMSAGVAAAKELKVMLTDLGQASGVDRLAELLGPE